MHTTPERSGAPATDPWKIHRFATGSDALAMRPGGLPAQAARVRQRRRRAKLATNPQYGLDGSVTLMISGGVAWLAETHSMDTGTRKTKGPEIGLHQAKRLCQLDGRRRLEFIAEGLPVILRSAQGFWQSSRQLSKLHGREAKVLEGFANEEAAKILILMDAARCPPKLIASKLNRIVGWFYDHLARLIYAESVSWKPMHLAQLREYVDLQRRGHFLEGHAGEYIMPNWTIYQRASRLYVDIEAHQDDALNWSSPTDAYPGHDCFDSFEPAALRVASAMEQVGLFTAQGLRAVSEVWGSLEYKDKEDHHDGEKLTDRLLHKLQSENLMLETAEQSDAETLYRDWQIPMYNLEFSMIPVSLEELEAAQEREYWSMVGDPR